MQNNAYIRAMAELDSLSSLNWINKELFKELQEKFQIKCYNIHIVCDTATRSNEVLNLACKLTYEFEGNEDFAKTITEEFVIIDSIHPLVLGNPRIKNSKLLVQNNFNNMKKSGTCSEENYEDSMLVTWDEDIKLSPAKILVKNDSPIKKMKLAQKEINKRIQIKEMAALKQQEEKPREKP